MDNTPLTAGDASIGAGFNRLMKRGAIFLSFKINQLQKLFRKKKNRRKKFSLAVLSALAVHKMHFATNGAGSHPGMKWSAQFMYRIDQNCHCFRVGMLGNAMAEVENMA